MLRKIVWQTMGRKEVARTASSSRSGFFQEAPNLGNQYEDDKALVSLVRRLIPAQTRQSMNLDEELHRFGARVVARDILDACEDAENNPPRHVPFDPWGHRVDKLVMAEGWKTMKRIAAEEGLISLAYDNQFGEHARTYQFAKYFLFAPSSAVFTCPLAMADGAARLIELLPQRSATLENALRHLLSRDPALAWTSGQWMTERPGGSDVSRTETIAVPDPNSTAYHISGFKWFSSATDSEMTLLLARLDDSPRLSLFFGHIHRPDGSGLNGIRIQRLKPKLGTKALPTAELELDGMEAELVGEPGRGVATIATVLNITRVHTAVNAVSFLRRALAIADSFASKRVAFGKLIKDHPLHKKTLWDLHAIYRQCLHLVFHTVAVLGRVEDASRRSDVNKEDELLLRLLTPVLKAWASKVSFAAISECCEALGGAGYVEDVGIARLLRDCQVLTIWEGTTNILSLDLRKLLVKDAAYKTAWTRFLSHLLQEVPVSPTKTAIEQRINSVASQLDSFDESDARNVLFDIGETTSAILLLAHAHATGDADDLAIATFACTGTYPLEILRPRL
ncbi:hypothetical protein LEN26_018777 [Aphanomyces euteiches]|nr:hypothetical protein LEN26_018777 [Aphanomyces euteiches]KAH9194818.1 hypothetical protein AeNC1_003214 [Aphanomyces euteiches]